MPGDSRAPDRTRCGPMVSAGPIGEPEDYPGALAGLSDFSVEKAMSMDSITLRKVARLARSRAEMTARDSDGHRDGLERLGALRALEQLARDLEVTADHPGA